MKIKKLRPERVGQYWAEGDGDFIIEVPLDELNRDGPIEFVNDAAIE